MPLSFPPAADGKGKEVVLRLGGKSLTSLLVASLLVLSVVPTLWDAALVPWLQKKDAEARRPAAELAAQRGSQEAGLWLGLHFPDQRFLVTPELGRKAHTVNVTYRSAIPGLSFCIGYAGAHGAVIPYTSDGEHCVIAGRDRLVQDSVFVNIGSPEALLIANIVLIDNRVSTETVPVGSAVQKAR